MKAVVFKAYGSLDALEFKEVDKPRAGDDDVLVRIRAAGINPSDWQVMRDVTPVTRRIFGLIGPKMNGLGSDLAGTVEAVGKNVTRFRPGDEVFGQVSDDAPGDPYMELSPFAEYACVPQDFLEAKPVNLSFEQAAAVPMAGFTALQGLRDAGRIASGQKVLINGASGGVGTFAVQIAKTYGADVTAVCSTRNVEIVRALGADRVIDYTREDFTRTGQRHDLILDNVGNRSFRECRRALTRKGIYVPSGGSGGNWSGPFLHLLASFVSSWFVTQKVRPLLAKRSRTDLAFLKELLESGRIAPVIDRLYPLTGVPDAIRYLATGHAQGKVIITI
ncbi:NAD(P)-dependent alcohol dehydrogenase [Uliginosibacterium sp. H1]|uniref:NAD(P)-dependent alcohol dehydrogenase n=1 Tax=Uliginosibacterium sp. H1 TaxID=3114757 RepID=UPI002E1A0009|nr:NAD(P)-dependent alcohol dehydrogenase [Uliginosibacterium sp. H1]